MHIATDRGPHAHLTRPLLQVGGPGELERVLADEGGVAPWVKSPYICQRQHMLAPSLQANRGGAGP